MNTTDKSHLIVQAKAWFGRVDYKPVNDVAHCHLAAGTKAIPLEKIEELRAAGYNIEIVQ